MSGGMTPPPLPGRHKWSTKRTVFVVIGVVFAGLTALALFIGAICFLVFSLIRASEPYQFASKTATGDERVIELLGEPIKPSWLATGSIKLHNQGGSADLNLSLSE